MYVHKPICSHLPTLELDNRVIVFTSLRCADIDTRRRAACDLVRGLCKFHEQPVIAIFSQYVVAMLQVRSQTRRG